MKIERRPQIEAACQRFHAAHTAAQEAQHALDTHAAALEHAFSRLDCARAVQRTGTTGEYLAAVAGLRQFGEQAGEHAQAQLSEWERLREVAANEWQAVNKLESELNGMETEVSELFEGAFGECLGHLRSFLTATLQPFCNNESEVKALLEGIPRLRQIQDEQRCARLGKTTAGKITGMLSALTKLEASAAIDRAAMQHAA